MGLVPELYDNYLPQQVANLFFDSWNLLSFAKAGVSSPEMFMMDGEFLIRSRKNTRLLTDASAL